MSIISISGLTVDLGNQRILDGVDLGPSTVVENPEWEEGLASSLRVGLDLLTRGRTERVFIVLGDEPSIPSDVPAALVLSLIHI